jgi:hypothetical protein
MGKWYHDHISTRDNDHHNHIFNDDTGTTVIVNHKHHGGAYYHIHGVDSTIDAAANHLALYGGKRIQPAPPGDRGLGAAIWNLAREE